MAWHGAFALFVLALLLPVGACADDDPVTREAVEAGAAKLYGERLAEARQRFELDADPAFLQRVRRIASGLIAQAEQEQIAQPGMAWEIHTTADPGENASCMAGGKLLIGKLYADRLELNDPELAMLIAHEMAHALLQHNLKEAREALRLEPQRAQEPYAALEYAIDHDDALMQKLDVFDRAQEFEADREGLILALHAGWHADALANYFRKLVRNDYSPNTEQREHPSPVRRRQAIQTLLKEIAGS